LTKGPDDQGGKREKRVLSGVLPWKEKIHHSCLERKGPKAWGRQKRQRGSCGNGQGKGGDFYIKRKKKALESTPARERSLDPYRQGKSADVAQKEGKGSPS